MRLVLDANQVRDQPDTRVVPLDLGEDNVFGFDITADFLQKAAIAKAAEEIDILIRRCEELQQAHDIRTFWLVENDRHQLLNGLIGNEALRELHDSLYMQTARVWYDIVDSVWPEAIDSLHAELSELRYVMGMTRELYEAARPFLTLIGSGDINVNAAPEPVLLALPGVTESVANQLIRLREAGSVPRNVRELQAMLPSAMAALLERADDDFDDNVTFATNEVEIASDGRVEGGPVRVRARVVVARSNTGAVVVWRKIE